MGQPESCHCCNRPVSTHDDDDQPTRRMQDDPREPEILEGMDNDVHNHKVGDKVAPTLPNDFFEGSLSRTELSREISAPACKDDALENRVSQNDGKCEDLSSTVEPCAITSEFEHLQQLCFEARVLDAFHALDSLRKKLDLIVSNPRQSKSGELKTALSLQERLTNDTIFAKVGSVHARLAPSLDLDTGSLAAALRGSESEWAKVEMRDSKISEEFCMEVAVRHLGDKERDAKGPSTQALIRIRIMNWPQELSDSIALDKEVDLLFKETVPDCNLWEGTVGGPQQLMSSMLHYAIRPATFPLVNIDFLNIREYVLCHNSPVPGYAAGVFVVENTPPSSNNGFEGWKIPPVKFGSARMTQQTIKHFCRSAECPGATNQTLVMTAAIQIPKFLVPAKLIANVILKTTMQTFARYKSLIVDKWTERGFADRVASERRFYAVVASLGSERQIKDDCKQSGGGVLQETPQETSLDSADALSDENHLPNSAEHGPRDRANEEVVLSAPSNAIAPQPIVPQVPEDATVVLVKDEDTSRERVTTSGRRVCGCCRRSRRSKNHVG